MPTYITISGFNGKKLHAKNWASIDNPPVAVVLIIHGMAEHLERYNSFANFLASHQISVIAYNHRGHGNTDPENLGFIDAENGFELLVEDLNCVYVEIQKLYPGIPIILFGHSMGSFITQRFMQIFKRQPAGIIYSGSNGKPPFMLHAGILVSSVLKKLFGPEAKSSLLEKMSFGAYNKKFRPNRSAFDWLSRDNAMVDLYIDDPLCGFTCSSSFYHQLFTGLKALHSHKPFSDHSKEIPMLIIAGDSDPVSVMGRGIKNLENSIRSSGVKDLEVQLYPGSRHELLNETNRDEVMDSIINWIERKLHSEYDA